MGRLLLLLRALLLHLGRHSRLWSRRNTMLWVLSWLAGSLGRGPRRAAPVAPRSAALGSSRPLQQRERLLRLSVRLLIEADWRRRLVGTGHRERQRRT